MPIDLRSKSSGSGEFIAKSFSGTLIVPSGVSGVIATISNSDPSKRVRLDSLFTRADPQLNVSIAVDGDTYISGTLADGSTSSAGKFSISETGSTFSSSADSTSATGVSKGVVGKEITISSTGLTTQALYYAYSEEK